MIEVPIDNLIACGGSIVATTFTFSKMFFTRLNRIEKNFGDAIEKLNENLNALDKNLAVNSAIIDRYMKGGELK